ncbi:MAG: hypothetical protein IJV37_06350 [Bacteroidales bacterium]|nr:hypothetical protein [Bacteroidales bacterium]
MKASKFLLVLLAAGTLLASCTERVVVPAPEMVKLDYDVRSGDWQLMDDYYMVTLNVPDITRYIVESGNVQVSRCYPGDSNGNDVWTPLPAMRVNVTEGADGADFFYTTYTDFEWTLGTVNVFVTTSDLFTGEQPEAMAFRVYISK